MIMARGSDLQPVRGRRLLLRRHRRGHVRGPRARSGLPARQPGDRARPASEQRPGRRCRSVHRRARRDDRRRRLRPGWGRPPPPPGTTYDRVDRGTAISMTSRIAAGNDPARGTQPAPRFWINTVTLDHVEQAVRGGFTQAEHGAAGKLRQPRRGDEMLFYSPRTTLVDRTPVRRSPHGPPSLRRSPIRLASLTISTPGDSQQCSTPGSPSTPNRSSTSCPSSRTRTTGGFRSAAACSPSPRKTS